MFDSLERFPHTINRHLNLTILQFEEKKTKLSYIINIFYYFAYAIHILWATNILLKYIIQQMKH